MTVVLAAAQEFGIEELVSQRSLPEREAKDSDVVCFLFAARSARSTMRNLVLGGMIQSDRCFFCSHI
jgi:hypothetical protein